MGKILLKLWQMFYGTNVVWQKDFLISFSLCLSPFLYLFCQCVSLSFYLCLLASPWICLSPTSYIFLSLSLSVSLVWFLSLSFVVCLCHYNSFSLFVNQMNKQLMFLSFLPFPSHFQQPKNLFFCLSVYRVF